MTDLRAEFEKWYASVFVVDNDMTFIYYESSNEYQRPNVDFTWQAYQAGHAAAVPEGFMVVPIEPTKEMKLAFHSANEWYENGCDGNRDITSPSYQWRAMLAVAPTPSEKQCWCTTCRPQKFGDMRFVVCPDCGHKRCPKANNHTNTCTNSNEVGQAGSSWEHVTPSKEQP